MSVDRPSVPNQLQEQLGRLQQLQQTLQAVVTQRRQLELELNEGENTLVELDKMTKDALIYKSIGSLLVKVEKNKIVEELKENKELLNARISVLGRQQKRAEERIKELQSNIQSSLGTISK